MQIMIYKRKDESTNRSLFLVMIAIGLAVVCLGLTQLYWAWNFVTFPLGLLLAISGYKNYKRANRKIKELEFLDDVLRLQFLNGEHAEIRFNDLRYSLLVKKFYKPLRAIEIIEKKRIGIFRGRSVGIIEFAKWDRDIEAIAKDLIKGDFERKKWRFGWSLGDFLMIFTILLGTTEIIATGYVEGFEAKLADPVGELAALASDSRARSVEESLTAEEKFLKKNGVK